RRRHTRCLSDWSSDVCSSDLKQRFTATETGGVSARSLFGKVLAARPGAPPARALTPQRQAESAGSAMDAAFANEPVQGQGEPTRSEERRVGKECMERGGCGWE